jgi:prolyl oligopeptidase
MRFWRLSTVMLLTVFAQIASADPKACLGFYKEPAMKYALWLEQNSILRQAWVSKESGDTIRKLHESDNYSTVSDVVLSLNSKPTAISADNNTLASYELRFMGLNKPQSLFRISSTGRKEILDTTAIKQDGSFSLLQVYATPKDSHVILTATDNGNTDIFQMYVYDLKAKKVVEHFQMDGQQIAWKNDNEFFFINAEKKLRGEKGPSLSTYNLKTGSVSVVKNETLMFVDKDAYVKFEDNHAHLLIKGKQKVFLPKSFFNTDIEIAGLSVRDNGDTMIFANDSWNNQGKVLRHSRKNGKSHWDVVYQTAKDSVIESVEFHDDHISVNTFWGPTIVTKILDYSGKEIASVPAPSCCLKNVVKFKSDSDIVDVVVSSHFKQGVTFKYSLKEKRYLDPTLENQMMSFNGVDFTSAIHWATSKDGTRIPVRLTYRKDLKRDGKNGLLIYGYGGFMSAGYMNSFNAKMDAHFIKNGGIIAGPALRGGNEFGKKWHESAMFENKHRTMEDFVATAKLVHAMELSSPANTAIQGWSNGGFLVSATGLLYPDVIGIVVSGNGVNDQLRKEVLDAQFGEGWAFEYGDSRKADVLAYLKQWSPVFRAQMPLPTPHMLFMNGRMDSRVNMAHSAKIAFALKHHSTTPENVNFVSLPNSGHFMTTVTYQNTIAWKAQTLIWTFLFDKMGMRALH